MRLAAVLLLTAAAAAPLSYAACGPRKGSHDSEGNIPMGTQASLARQESESMRASHSIKTVWVIVMENHSWKNIQGNPNAPDAAHCFSRYPAIAAFSARMAT